MHVNVSLHGLCKVLFISSWGDFGCNLWLQLIQNHATDCFQTFCSEVAVLFGWDLSRHPILGLISNLDLLLCTGLNLQWVDLFLCLSLTQRPMNDQKIEQSW